MIKDNTIAILIIAAGMLVATTVQPIGGVLMVLFGMACGSTEKQQ